MRGEPGPLPSRFDLIILLSALAKVLMERLTPRTTNSYGKTPGELGRVLDDLQAVEPLLRKAADHEVRTTMPLSDMVTTVLHLAGALAGRQDTPASCSVTARDPPWSSPTNLLITVRAQIRVDGSRSVRRGPKVVQRDR